MLQVDHEIIAQFVESGAPANLIEMIRVGQADAVRCAAAQVIHCTYMGVAVLESSAPDRDACGVAAMPVSAAAV